MDAPSSYLILPTAIAGLTAAPQITHALFAIAKRQEYPTTASMLHHFVVAVFLWLTISVLHGSSEEVPFATLSYTPAGQGQRVQTIDVSDFKDDATACLDAGTGYWLMITLQETLLLQFFVGGVFAVLDCSSSFTKTVIDSTKRIALAVVFGLQLISAILWVVGAYKTESDIKAACCDKTTFVTQSGNDVYCGMTQCSCNSFSENHGYVASVGSQFWIMFSLWLVSTVIWILEWGLYTPVSGSHPVDGDSSRIALEEHPPPALAAV